MNSVWHPPHSLITPTCHLGVFGSAIVCVPWQSVQPGACSTLVARSFPCWLPAQTFFTLPWQVPQVSGMLARETALSGSFFGRMSCVPWQSVQTGTLSLDLPVPCRGLPWMLSWYIAETLPPGTLPSLMSFSSPWQAPQVVSRFARLVFAASSEVALMSCVPWQSLQVAATILPPARARPWMVVAYSLTAFSWQLAHWAGSTDLCGYFRNPSPAWQSTHAALPEP